jgi:hypothetical protein
MMPPRNGLLLLLSKRSPFNFQTRRFGAIALQWIVFENAIAI